MTSQLPNELWRRSARFIHDLMKSPTQIFPRSDPNHTPSPARSAEAADGNGAPKSTSGNRFIDELLESLLVRADDWEALSPEERQSLSDCQDKQQILNGCIALKLLTPYQATRIGSASTFGLLLGNYRVLDRLGAGGMGIVLKAEHLELRTLAAIKVFSLTPETDPRLVSRFLAEMRTVAQLKHPNIIGAIDAGKAPGPDAHSPGLRYFVMEYVRGSDLEAFVNEHGPLPIPKACDLIHQVASALAEVHKLHLVHRDIKPSNVIVTPEDLAKLVDFGLARHFSKRMTEPGMALGTIDYIAPEQAHDATAVDIRADIYGLGGTLFWCLTGRVPFPAEGNIAEDLARRLTQPPPSVRALRPDVPPELDALVAKMMAIDPCDRYATPQALTRGLLPFLKPEQREQALLSGDAGGFQQNLALSTQTAGATRMQRALLVDDEAGIRAFARHILQAEGITCDEAANGFLGVEAAHSQPYDVVILDVAMPVLSGLDALRKLRENPPVPNLKIIMVSGDTTPDEMAKMLSAGADDYLSKPFSLAQFQGRVKAALRLKEAQDRSEMLNKHLLAVSAEQEQMLTARDSDLVHARNALVLALAKLVEHRDNETGAHLVRLQRYCRFLAEQAASAPQFAAQIDPHFIEMLECCAPLHDIGKLGLPDHILLKPGKLTNDERILMQAHTTIGADTLSEVAKQHGFARAFLQMAIDITRHHHERYDGVGYPDRLAGTTIPLSARIVAIADVYDALRSRRVYKPALSHGATVQMMTEASSGHFDPALMHLFQLHAQHFDKIFREYSD